MSISLLAPAQAELNEAITWYAEQAPGLGPEVWRVLDKCHNTRNLGEYEGLLDVDARLVADLITAAQTVADAIQW